jgi:CrcB protein
LKRYLYIGIGGVFGAITRYAIKSIHIYGYESLFPINTLIINILGSFLLALLLTSALEVLYLDGDIRTGLGTGFLGAFTTFSTMSKEAVILMRGGHYFSAVSYLGISSIFGLAAAYLGVITIRKGLTKIISSQKGNALNESGISEVKEE